MSEKSTPILNNFRSGELTPNMDAQVNLKVYNQGCRTLQNAMPIIEGGIIRVPGTYYVRIIGQYQRIVTEDGKFIVTEDGKYLIVG